MIWRFISGIIAVTVSGAVLGAMLYSPERTVSLFEKKRRGADTLLLYELRQGETIKFNTLPGSDMHFLVSHCLLPADHRYNPDQTFEYGLHLSFADKQGKKKHDQTYWEKSRQSKAEPDGDSWALENAFLPLGEGELTDDRITVVAAGRVLPEGGRVHITLKESGFPVLLRIYRIEPRSDLERFKRYQLMPEYRKETIASYMGFESLDQLPLSDLWRLFQKKWQRVEATTPTGDNARKHRIYYHGFRLARVPKDDTVIELEPKRSLAFNLAGPLDIHFVLVEPDKPTKLRVAILTSTPESVESAAPVDLDVVPDRPTELSLPAGDNSVVIENSSNTVLRFRIALGRKPTRLIGHALFLPDAAKVWDSYLIPERSRFHALSITGEDDGSAQYSTLGLKTSELMRLDLRAALRSFEDNEKRVFNIEYLNSAGRVIRSYALDFEPIASRFERLWIDDRQTDDWLSDPYKVYLTVSPKTRRVRVSSDRRLLARAFVEHPKAAPENAVGDPPYPELADELHWRYRKGAANPWHSIEGENWRRLSDEGRIPKIDAQARMVHTPKVEAEPPHWQSILARGRAGVEHLFVQINIRSEEALLVRNPRGFRLRCPLEKDIQVKLLPDPAGAKLGILEALYYLPTEIPLEGVISVSQNGKGIANIDAITRKGTVRIRRVRRQGILKWSHTYQNGTPLLFYKILPSQGVPYQPPGKCRLLKSYSVTRVEPGRSAVLPVAVDGTEPRTVNIIAYSSRLPRLGVLLDGGKLKRREGPAKESYTLSRRELEPQWNEEQGFVWMPARPEEKLRTTEAMFVGLGSDLSQGIHTMTVRNTGRSTVWIRSFTQAKKANRESLVNVRTLK